MHKTGFVFDIDGVIVDSEEIHFKALQTVLGKTIRTVPVDALIGLSLEETLLNLGVEEYRTSDLSLMIENVYINLIGKSHLREGVIDTINLLYNINYPFGFVSSASRRVCEANLRLLGIAESYPLISRDDVLKTKPEADPYLALCSLLDITPANTIAIEDSDIGVTSAYNAGIRKIYGWPHDFSSGQTYRLCSQKINHLLDIEEIKYLKSLKTLPE